MSGDPTSRARGLGAVVRGAAAGLFAGALWAGTEAAVNWAGGGTAPLGFVRTVAMLDLAIGGGVGLVAGAVFGVLPLTSLAIVLTLAYGFVNVVALPGMGAEALYLVLAPLGWLAARALVGRRPLGPLGFAHVVLLGCAGLLLGELWLDARHADGLRGVWLPAASLGLPLAALALDRTLAVVLPARATRLAAGVLAAVGATAVWGAPLDVQPRRDPVVTSVPPPAGTPDVVLVTLDTTRADHLSTYGYERDTSPNLTALAADGELYRMARSPAGWTLPAHASIMTGQYPSTHGAHLAGGVAGTSVDGRPQVARPLPPSAVTLAEVLRDHGYETGAFVANFSYLYRDYGLAQGFGVYDDAPGVMLRVRPPAARFWRQIEPAFGVKPFRTARDVNAAALAWLDGLSSGRPAFLFVNYMEPHQPWVAEAPWDRWARGLPRARGLARKNLYTHAVRAIDADTTAFIRANYDGQVAAMDAALGELVAALRARGRYENALVIVAGDHGELLGDHGLIGHMGRMLYEPLLRVPLVVKYPGTAGPHGAVDAPVQLVDLLPTVTATLGLRGPDGMEGVELHAAQRAPYAEEGINPFLARRYGAAYDRSVRVLYDGSYKLISTSRGERWLFDLARDPAEEHDLASHEPGRLAQLVEQLELRAPRLAARESTEKVR